MVDFDLSGIVSYNFAYMTMIDRKIKPTQEQRSDSESKIEPDSRPLKRVRAHMRVSGLTALLAATKGLDVSARQDAVKK